ncbi:MAG TPA: hypothetical protein VGK44_13275 [Casimicrobiaceae bacterium]|jgi:hypothetical protein
MPTRIESNVFEVDPPEQTFQLPVFARRAQPIPVFDHVIYLNDNEASLDWFPKEKIDGSIDSSALPRCGTAFSFPGAIQDCLVVV